MASLNDVLNNVVRKGYYTRISHPGIFYKFTSFGSLRCPAEVYDSNGNLVEKLMPPVDGVLERNGFELVPENLLPETLRQAEYAQSQPSCTKVVDETEEVLVNPEFPFDDPARYKTIPKKKRDDIPL